MTEIGSPSPTDQIIDAAAALKAGAPDEGAEKRAQKRHAYDSLVAVMLAPVGVGRSRPIVLRASDLSAGGISVAGSGLLPVGAPGVLQLVRMDGRFALVGIEVRHCRYIAPMTHQTGLQFIPLPDSFTREEFLDEDGRMILMDPLLRQNCS